MRIIFRKYDKIPFNYEEATRDPEEQYVDKFYWTKREDLNMKKLKNTENSLMKRLYYNNKNVSPRKEVTSNFTRMQQDTKDFNKKLIELDKSLNVKDIIKQINRTSVQKEKKTMLKSILRKHYFSQEKSMKPKSQM